MSQRHARARRKDEGLSKVSKDVLDAMIKGSSDVRFPIFVGIQVVNGLQSRIFDQKHSVLIPKLASVTGRVLEVKGYVTSTCNLPPSVPPFLILVNYESKHHLTTATVAGEEHPIVKSEPGRKVQTGPFGAFLSQIAPYVSNEKLGGPPLPEVQRVTDFLSSHAAVVTLQNSCTPHPTSNNDVYAKALQEFKSLQMERQNASLTSNSGREDAVRSFKVVENYKAALVEALSHPGVSLTAALLQKWHSTLCAGLHPEAGRFRAKNVKAGPTSFPPAAQLQSTLADVLEGIAECKGRLLRNDHTQASGRDVLTFAAIVFFGIVDVHPFSDGNGRLARICLNWALYQGGFPFVINLFATPQQRKKYIHAILVTQRNVNLVSRGQGVSEAALHQAYAHAGMMGPLVELLCNRACKAVADFQILCQEVATRVSEEAREHAAREHREREAARGTCMICMDEKPNIATLCCGKAVHLNCIAEWLSSKNSCPQCRAEMPTLPERQARRAVNDEPQPAPVVVAAASNDTTTGDDDDDEQSSQTSDASLVNDTTSDDVSSTGEDATNDDETMEEAQAGGEDTTTISDGPPADEGTSDSTSDADSTTSPAAEQPRILICNFGRCHNRAAVDCVNDGCGRCCVIHGLVVGIVLTAFCPVCIQRQVENHSHESMRV